MMCIVSFAWKAHPKWQLVAIGNRDELHARPAESAHRWEDSDHLLAGRDSRAGGTWLGISEQGRFAVVTNLYGFGTPRPDRASRGDLLKDFLSGKGKYADIAAADYADFNPFNLITVTQGEARVHTNRPDKITKPLDHGVHGLSNGSIHQPWAKSPHLNEMLGQWIAKQSDDPVMLLDGLLDRNSYESRDPSSPVIQSDPEPENSAIFMCDPIYGTRCSTVVAIDHDGNGIFIERRFAPSGSAIGQTRLSFAWPTPG
ncbi:NRDE family protein [Parasphingorhabdus sp.]|uniref:NRDE family protein n=1 Tax=Parasphingorhabdus sp. TaxID=2709688 RepID=UPI003A909C2B